MDEQQYYAEVEIHEYGEESLFKVLGPFSAESPEELEDNLRRRGDDVVRIFTIEGAP